MKKALQEITQASNLKLGESVLDSLNPEANTVALISNQKDVIQNGKGTTILDLDRVREYLMQFGVDIQKSRKSLKN